MPLSSSYDFYIQNTKCNVSRIATARTLSQTDHRHKHATFEFHYIITGACSFLIGDQYINVKQGDALLISPNIYHSVKDFSADFYKLCFYFDFSTVKGSDSKDLQNLISLFSNSKASMIDAREQESLLASILELHSKPLSWLEVETLKAYLTLLFLWLTKQLTTQPISMQSEANATIDSNTIIHFFTKNFHLTNGADVLAKKLHVSRRHLERIIKKQFGKNYREMLFEVRLEVAMDLLHTTNKTIAEISEIVGYSNPAGFITFMKNMTGMTPLQYRKQKASEAFRV